MRLGCHNKLEESLAMAKWPRLREHTAPSIPLCSPDAHFDGTLLPFLARIFLDLVPREKIGSFERRKNNVPRVVKVQCGCAGTGGDMFVFEALQAEAGDLYLCYAWGKGGEITSQWQYITPTNNSTSEYQ